MEIKNYIAPLLKWWWLIITAAILASATSYFVVRQEPILYQSKATILIGNPFASLNPDSSELWASTQLAEAYAGFAQREPVRDATMKALNLDWLPQYSVTVPPRTQFIEVVVIDSDPQRAQIVANEIANQLIQLSPSGADQERNKRQDFIDQQLDDLQKQIEETRSEIETRQFELGELVSAREIAEAQGQIAALQSKLSTLQLNYSAILSNSQDQATNILNIIEPATLPQYPIGPQKALTIILSGVLGAVLAGSAAYLLEYLDDRIESPQELERIANVPILPSIPRSKNIATGPLVTIGQPRAPVSEVFRDLRTRVQFSELDKANRTILVTSANPGEGKSFIAANLSIVFAQAGFKTLLIDADLRLPDQHKMFELSNRFGLTDILRNPNNLVNQETTFSDLDDYLSKIPGVTLDVITRGSPTNNPSELLGSPTMRELLVYVAKQYDFVFIDSAPSLSLTDSLILGRRVGGVLLVVSAKGTRRNQVKLLVSRFRDVNANLIGITLNKLAQKNIGYYDYSYGNLSENSTTPGKKNFRGKSKQITEELAKE